MEIEYSIGFLYVVVNALRIVFYIPQIMAIARCQNGAVSNSLATWGYFAISHWVAVMYFTIGQRDHLALMISLGNAIAVSVLVGTILWRRDQKISRNTNRVST